MIMMFEVEDLDHASPATVSRCGMIYYSEKTVGIDSLYKSWKENNSVNFKDFIVTLDKIFNDSNLMVFNFYF